MAEPHPALDEAKHLVGHTIADRYRVDAVLGAGGMGAVFRCHHLTLKRDVAVKILHPELTSDPEVAPRFDREAQSASRLEHPNIMQVFDYGSWTPPGATEPIKFMVMQLLDGHELSDELGAQLAPARAVDLMIQIMRGLEHAHEHGIIHRDLKPENVYVTKDHTGAELLKLVDFGIAKVVSGEGSEDKLTRMGLVFGTPHYMSPEQATGMPVDERADVYSAGVMFYEMLAGQVPFQGDDPVAVIRMQVGVDPPPLPPSVPAPVVDIVMRMLVKDREQRMPTAMQARQALEAVRPMIGAGASSTTAPRVDVSAATMMPVPAPGPARTGGGALDKITARVHDLSRQWGLPPAAIYGVGGATVLVLFLIVIVVARADGPEGTSSTPAKVEPAAPLSAVGDAIEAVVDDSASDEDVAELDRLIALNDDAAALTMLDELLKEHANDARLHWRRGKLLGRDKKKSNAALLEFREAMEHDPKLLDDKEFYAELLDVMRRDQVTGEAIEVAIGVMGEHGHPFLLELVNREKGALKYSDRHRVLALLDEDEQMAKLIDRKLNVVHDLWQAAATDRPCDVFDNALRKIELAPEPYYLGTVHKVKVPKSKNPTDAKECAGLDDRLMKLRLDLSARYPEADKERWVPEDYKSKKKRRRGGFGGLFGG